MLFDISTSTPGCITTLRTIFSPMKFLVNPSALAFIFPPASSSVPAFQLRLCIPDLNLPQTSLIVLVQVYIDGEMGIDVSHLILEALRDADNQVVDQGSDCAESSDVLAGAMVQLDVDDVLLWVREVDC
jgi:hypothetical protein